MEEKINYKAITLQDCIDLYEMKNNEVVIENGNITNIINMEGIHNESRIIK